MSRWSIVVLLWAAGAAHADVKFDPFANAHAPAEEAVAEKPVADAPESVTPEAIARFTAPPVVAEVSRHIQAMLDVRGAGGGIVGDRGDRQVFNARVTGTTQVWRQDGPMKLAVQLTGGEEPTSVVAMSPDEKWLVVTRDVGGSEHAGLYVVAVAGGPLRVVMREPNVRAELAYISDDSKAVYFDVTDRDAASNAIYRWDVSDGKTAVVFDSPGRWHVVDHRDGRWLMTKELGSSQNELYDYELATKKLTMLLGSGAAELQDARYGAKPGEVLLRARLGEHQALYTLVGGKLVAIGKASAYAVSAFAIDQARTRIYYVQDVGGYARMHVLDARTLRPVEMPELPVADNQTLAGLSRNGRFVQIALDGATLPPITVTWDWRARRLETWRVPATPEIDASAFAPVTAETYATRDGAKLPMFVRRPANCAAPCPVVVELRGREARPGFSPYAQLFVDAGFVFVEPNVRAGVPGDIEDLSRYLRGAWAKDGKAPKLGVIGGDAALIAMTTFAGAFDAGVAEYAVSDAAGKVNAPLLLVVGANDPRTPLGTALQMHDDLERRGMAGGLIIFPDEGHGAAKRANIVLELGNAITFLGRHLR